jgi:hypothetical protein
LPSFSLVKIGTPPPLLYLDSKLNIYQILQQKADCYKNLVILRQPTSQLENIFGPIEVNLKVNAGLNLKHGGGDKMV